MLIKLWIPWTLFHCCVFTWRFHWCYLYNIIHIITKNTCWFAIEKLLIKAGQFLMLPIYARTIYLFFFWGGGFLLFVHCIAFREAKSLICLQTLKVSPTLEKKVVKYTRIVGIPKRWGSSTGHVCIFFLKILRALEILRFKVFGVVTLFEAKKKKKKNVTWYIYGGRFLLDIALVIATS